MSLVSNSPLRITGTLEKDAKFAVSYKNVTAPPAGDYDFAVKSKVTAEGDLEVISGSPLTIRVRAVDPGAVTLSLNSANPGDSLGDLVFTYTAAANLDAGAVIQITIPEGWQQPSRANDEDDARSGAVSLSANAGITSIGTAPMTIVATTSSAVADGETGYLHLQVDYDARLSKTRIRLTRRFRSTVRILLKTFRHRRL